MAVKTNSRDEHRDLRQSTAQAQLTVLQSQLLLASTLCDAAEAEIPYGDLRRAITSLRQVADSIRLHVADPNHVPPDATNEISERFAQLENRIARLQSRVLP